MQNRSVKLSFFALFFAICAIGSAACGGSSSGLAAPGTAGAGGSDAGAEGGKVQVAFVPHDGITLDPKESRELTVQTTPAGQFPIRFALIASDPAADAVFDAVLDATEVQSDAQGIAHVNLIAPSEPTSFNVRASSLGAQDLLGVKVSKLGVTALQVKPSYSGHRRVAEWTATAQAGVSCNSLSGNPPSDGSRVSSAKPGAPLVLKVPVDVNLAITVRAGHYIGGCVNLPALSEGDGNQVLVYASDRPLNLATTNLSLSLGATDAHPAFDKLLQASATSAESALLGAAKSDIAALLDDMLDATPSIDREAFDLARSANGWDSALESAFGKGAARRLRDPALRWLSAGLSALNAPDALVGQLAPVRAGASFTPTSVGGMLPDDAGFPGSFVAQWSADSNDTVLLGMTLTWQPSRLVTALAVAPALLEVPMASSVEDALARVVDCAALADVLVTSGTSPGVAAFASCDESCTVSACRKAVATAWSRAQSSSGAELATLSVTASGTATIGDDARATALSGSWLGELQTDGGKAPVSGALSAE